MKKLKLLVLLSLGLLVAGCKSGGGGGGSASSSGAGSLYADNPNPPASFYYASTTDSGSGTSVPTYHNPEPTSIALLGIGLAGLAARRLRKKKLA